MTRYIDILKLYKNREYTERDAIAALMRRGFTKTAAMTAVMQA